MVFVSYSEQIAISGNGQGLTEFTDAVLHHLHASGVETGVVTLFVRHTSASLVIQENADPTAKHDLAEWIKRLVPENDPNFTHTYEGADDMPAHIKSALTNTSLSIPVHRGQLALGTWQGIYLWEHRDSSPKRDVVVNISGTKQGA